MNRMNWFLNPYQKKTKKTSCKMIISEKTLSQTFSYLQYHELIDNLLNIGKTTGNDQSEEMISYAKLNQQRMKRWDKMISLRNELKDALMHITKPITWLVITEGWCGDAAQNIPALNKMANVNKFIELKLVLRDENPELMDRYLTNGARAIPKLICFKPESDNELFTWGPRPQDAQTIILHAKQKGLPKEEMYNQLHLWYRKDNSQSIQNEILSLISKHLI